MTEQELTQKFYSLNSRMERAYTSIDVYDSQNGSVVTGIDAVNIAEVVMNYETLQKIRPEYEELLKTFYQNIFLANPKLALNSSADETYQKMVNVQLKVERTMALAELLIATHENKRKLEERCLEEQRERFMNYLGIILGTLSVVPMILFFKNL